MHELDNLGYAFNYKYDAHKINLSKEEIENKKRQFIDRCKADNLLNKYPFKPSSNPYMEN